MNNKQYFIKTSDEQTAQYLRESGFPELAKEGEKYVFANINGKMDFSKEDLKVYFDNRLCF